MTFVYVSWYYNKAHFSHFFFILVESTEYRRKIEITISIKLHLVTRGVNSSVDRFMLESNHAGSDSCVGQFMMDKFLHR